MSFINLISKIRLIKEDNKYFRSYCWDGKKFNSLTECIILTKIVTKCTGYILTNFISSFINAKVAPKAFGAAESKCEFKILKLKMAHSI